MRRWGLVIWWVLAAGVWWVSPTYAKTKWESVDEAIRAANAQPFLQQLALLRSLRASGKPWSLVDQCRFALTEAFILWDSGNLDEAARVLAKTADEVSEPGPSEALLLGWIEHLRGTEAYIRSDHQQALRLSETAVKYLREANEPRDLASALVSYAEVGDILDLGRPAREAWLEARELYAKVGDELQVAFLDITLLGMDWDSEEMKKTRHRAFFEAMDLFRRKENREGIVYGTLALVDNGLLPVPDLLKALDEIEYIAKEKGDGLAEFSIAHYRLSLYYDQKDYASAVVHGRRALALARALGDLDYTRWILVDLGRALLELGLPEQRDETWNLLQEGLRMNEEFEDSIYVALAKLGLARIALERDNLPAAREYAEACLTLLEADEHPQERSRALAVLARIIGKQGDTVRAYELMEEAYELSVKMAEDEIQRILAETSAKYENEIQNNALKLAQMERKLAEERLDLQSAELNVSETLRARDRRFRNLSIASGIGAGGLSLVLAVMLLLRRKTLHRVEALNEALQAETDALAREAAQREEANRELQAANLRLKLLDEERKSLLGMAAHDMRNPVGAIQSSLDLLNVELDQGPRANLGEIREYVNLASEASAILLESIERIVAVRQQQNLQTHLNLRRFDPRALIAQTVQLNQSAAARKNMRLVLAEMPTVEVEADGQALRTSLDNLLSNAIKFSFPGAEIRVELEVDDGLVAIKVEDGGPGIPADELDRLFLPFAALSNRPTGGERSTGLGLASVKTAVEAMGGEVLVENRVESTGARFIIRLSGNII